MCRDLYRCVFWSVLYISEGYRNFGHKLRICFHQIRFLNKNGTHVAMFYDSNFYIHHAPSDDRNRGVFEIAVGHHMTGSILCTSIHWSAAGNDHKGFVGIQIRAGIFHTHCDIFWSGVGSQERFEDHGYHTAYTRILLVIVARYCLLVDHSKHGW